MHDLLRALREAAGLTVDEAAAASGCGRSTIYAYESRLMPAPSSLATLLRVYAATPENQAKAWKFLRVWAEAQAA